MPVSKTPIHSVTALSARLSMGVLFTAMLSAPASALAATLSLPGEATVGVEVVDAIHFSGSDDRQEGVLLRPAETPHASHTLPEYCVIVGDAQRADDRVRITAHDVTCIETEDADSSIFSGQLDASAYGDDGQYGIACPDNACTLTSGHAFTLTLADSLEITEQENPSEEINKQRRKAKGEGVANPIPAERPDPEATPIESDDAE